LASKTFSLEIQRDDTALRMPFAARDAMPLAEI
jgi:hypothetical protein